MSRLQYIRRSYGVPAFRGRRIRYTGGAEPRDGVITAASGGQLRVRLEGHKRPVTLHPTWQVEYLEGCPPHCTCGHSKAHHGRRLRKCQADHCRCPSYLADADS